MNNSKKMEGRYLPFIKRCKVSIMLQLFNFFKLLFFSVAEHSNLENTEL